jgi:isoquinoline 1-oxidoreductase beta subunit
MTRVESSIDRRAFIKLTAAAGGGMLVGVGFVRHLEAAATSSAVDEHSLNAWVRIDTSGQITVSTFKSEMGQGVWTSLPIIIAEELDADWRRIKIEQAPTTNAYDTETGGSSSVPGSWVPLRTAGAAARGVLIAAAARQWNVEASECTTEPGVVVHAPSARRADYGSLAGVAATLSAPDAAMIRLKDASQFRLIGSDLARRDLPAKVTGEATFGIDVKVQGMLIACVARCPTFGGKVARLDDRKARAVPGVRDVIVLDPVPRYHPGRVAVLADDTWSAMQGRRALAIEWDFGPDAGYSTDQMWIDARAAVQDDSRALLVAKAGEDVLPALHGAKVVEATYELPFVAHACMEPMNCTAHVRDDSADVWVPSQFPRQARDTAARRIGLPPEKVNVHVTFLGGGFGRRAYQDFVIEAVDLSQRTKRPVKVLYTREDDIQHDFYRPAQLQRFRAILDERGHPVMWHNRGVGLSQERFWNPQTTTPQRREAGMRGPYEIPNWLIDFVDLRGPVPLGAWRAVQNGLNGYFFESFVDECAHAAKQDPVSYRLALVRDNTRLQNVIRLAADQSGWSTKLPAGRGRGIAVFDYAGTRVAQVAEVRVSKAGAVMVERVVCAFDCGIVVSPDTVRSQIESSIIWGISAALYGEVTIKNGRTEQSNFHNYKVLKLAESPRIDVQLVKNGETPTGVGEPAVPPVAPAIANAVFAATGQRVRKLPMRVV